jgi:outer membrane protein OmpA-like peptidoglycan-associated protein
MLERLGVPGRKACFDRQRTDRLRLMALAGEQRGAFPPSKPVTAPLPPSPTPVAPLPPPPALPEPPATTLPVTALPSPPAPVEVEQTAVIGNVEILTPAPKAPPQVEPRVESAEEPTTPVATAKGGEPATAAAPKAPQGAKKEKKPRPAPPAEKVAAAEAASPASAAPKSLSVRQADWLTRLQSGERVLVEELSFVGRTSQLEKEHGLADVVALLGVAPGLKIRIEGFVDASSDPDGDLRLSMEMARATGKRLIELGVARDRVNWAGRGGEAPILPNFTSRGRMANRRVELIEAR